MNIKCGVWLEGNIMSNYVFKLNRVSIGRVTFDFRLSGEGTGNFRRRTVLFLIDVNIALNYFIQVI